MVAPVDTGAELWKRYLKEGVNHDAGLAHALEKPVLYSKRAYVIINHPHSDTGQCAFDQNIGDFVADAVVLKYIIFQIDIMARIDKISLKPGEFIGTVGEDFYIVAVVELCVGHRLGQPDILYRTRRQIELAEVGVRHSLALFQLAPVASAQLMLVGDIAPKKQIQYDTYHRQQ